MRSCASLQTWACLSVWLVAAVLAHPARGDDPPPLTAPAGSSAPDESPAAIPPAANPAPTPATPIPPPRTDRPVLVLPGVTMRPPRPAAPAAPLPPSLAPSPDGGLPSLAPPLGASPSRPADATGLPALPSSRFRGRVIESTPAEEGLPAIDVPRSASPGFRGTVPPATRRLDEPFGLEDLDMRDLAADRKKGDESDVETHRDLPMTAPARRGFLGSRWINPFAGRPPMDDERSAIRAEPRTDPAADAALKRRVEKQAVTTVGDRARSVEVHVVGRSITIQARGVKIFQRRAVRRDLERLPVISGFRSVVELVD